MTTANREGAPLSSATVLTKSGEITHASAALCTGEVLSPPQRRTLEFVRGFIAAHVFPPTLREIAEGTACSSSAGIARLLGILEREGYIERDKKISRGIRVTAKGRAA